MEVLLTVFHVLTCIALILIVLLQHGKGADIGVQFGASQTVFGARGAGTFLTKLTTGAAIIFMSTSFVLSKMSGRTDISEILEVPAGEQAPAAPGAPQSEVEAQPIEGDAPAGSELPGFEQIEPPVPAAEPSGDAPDATPPGEAPAEAAPPAPAG